MSRVNKSDLIEELSSALADYTYPENAFFMNQLVQRIKINFARNPNMNWNLKDSLELSLKSNPNNYDYSFKVGNGKSE